MICRRKLLGGRGLPGGWVPPPWQTDGVGELIYSLYGAYLDPSRTSVHPCCGVALDCPTNLDLEPIPVEAAPSHCTRRRCSESSCTVSTFRFLRSGATHTASARLPTEMGSYAKLSQLGNPTQIVQSSTESGYKGAGAVLRTYYKR
ncbi:hypothetical protein Cenrod_0400 [Candidatus Symbiobacter mobilis CR]|uniref:Uncharacterized protein n=1 Tax=Candidatus Symbiobacter mobilis CR TaxID=946483 RepID=U5N597_9BURK|nr:hypothetical protein Cenrod_0400 [Candidatus Symbiobacter mobilis CR]